MHPQITRLARYALVIATLPLFACGGGSRAVETGIAPSRSPAAQPVRDASGQTIVETVTLPEGSEFTVATIDELSSKTAATGDPVTLEVTENVQVNGVVVITSGTKVRAVVSDVVHAGRMGKSGSLNLRLESTTSVDGQKVRLRATRAARTDDKTGSTVALAVVVSPLFLLRKGSDVHYKPGTAVTAYTDEPVVIRGWKQ